VGSAVLMRDFVSGLSVSSPLENMFTTVQRFGVREIKEMNTLIQQGRTHLIKSDGKDINATRIAVLLNFLFIKESQ